MFKFYTNFSFPFFPTTFLFFPLAFFTLFIYFFFFLGRADHGKGRMRQNADFSIIPLKQALHRATLLFIKY